MKGFLKNKKGDGGATAAILLLLFGAGICAANDCFKKNGKKYELTPPPAACVQLPPAAFSPEKRPSVAGREMNDKTAALIISDAGRVIVRYENRFFDLAALEKKRVELGCLSAR